MTVEQLARTVARLEIQIRDLTIKGKTLLVERDKLVRRVEALENARLRPEHVLPGRGPGRPRKDEMAAA
jgi:hypothetical protein